MNNWEGSDPGLAEEAAKHLGIKLHVINLRKDFKKEVIDYYLKSYLNGETPNPCVMCNPLIKFGRLFDEAKKLGADYLATGHYAQIKKNKGLYELHKGVDQRKDQSYFLYRLSQKQLSRTLFPLGTQEKTQTRKTGKKFGLRIAEEKNESQGICFIQDKFYTDFLKKHLPAKYFKEGLIVDTEGNKLGRHRGLPYYTCGQRKGIRIGGPGGPYYVIKMDHKENLLIVGEDKDLWHKEIYARDLSFISGKTPKKATKVEARIRHLGNLEPGKLEIQGKKAKITFDRPVRAFTEGQSIVFYKNTRVLGGGIMQIEK